MNDIRFDGKVALVTGAGGGLGRLYALGLAARGAKIIVNDLGGGVDGAGQSSSAAQAVVDEIKAAGGEAVANHASVTDAGAMEKLVEDAVARWDSLDILIANAGILRDKSFAKLGKDDFEAVVDVHLIGTMVPIRAAWAQMKEQNYGRIVVTTSSSGLYGNFGQANYGAAKLGIIGLMNTLRIEGQKNDIRVNAISPVAATRMTENLASSEVLARIRPEYVAPGVLYLCSGEAPSGAILTAGAGTMALARIFETEGHYFGDDGPSVEAVRDNWEAISSEKGQRAYALGDEQAQKFFRQAGMS